MPDTPPVDPEPQAGTTSTPPAPTPDPKPDEPPAPPWGSAADFDPEKAWNLIQNLRGDLDKARPALAKVRELEDAKLTETQRLEKERDEARNEAGSKKAEVAILRAAIKYDLDEDDLELLEGVAVDKVDERAKKLASRRPASTPRSTRRPAEALRGGGGAAADAEPVETDLAKIGERMFHR